MERYPGGCIRQKGVSGWRNGCVNRTISRAQNWMEYYDDALLLVYRYARSTELGVSDVSHKDGV